MPFHPDLTPRDDSGKNKDPHTFGRVANFFATLQRSAQVNNFLHEQRRKAGLKSLEELNQYEDDKSQFQQIVHNEGNHVSAASPTEGCDECDFLSYRHGSGAHHNNDSDEGAQERSTCWHCKNESE